LNQPRILSQPVKKLHTEVLAAGIFEDVRPLRGPAEEVDWVTGGLLSALIRKGRVTGKRGEAVLMATQNKIPASKVMIIGLGPRAQFDHSGLRIMLESTCEKLLLLKAKHCVTELFGAVQCRMKTDEVTQEVLSVLNAQPGLKDIELSFLMDDDIKAQQLRQDLAAVSVIR
jgi:hypothetical protein